MFRKKFCQDYTHQLFLIGRTKSRDSGSPEVARFTVQLQGKFVLFLLVVVVIGEETFRACASDDRS